MAPRAHGCCARRRPPSPPRFPSAPPRNAPPSIQPVARRRSCLYNFRVQVPREVAREQPVGGYARAPHVGGEAIALLQHLGRDEEWRAGPEGAARARRGCVSLAPRSRQPAMQRCAHTAVADAGGGAAVPQLSPSRAGDCLVGNAATSCSHQLPQPGHNPARVPTPHPLPPPPTATPPTPPHSAGARAPVGQHVARRAELRQPKVDHLQGGVIALVQEQEVVRLHTCRGPGGRRGGGRAI